MREARVEEAGRDRVDADAVRRPFDRQILRQRDDGALAGRVGDGVEHIGRQTAEARDRCDVDDGAAPACAHHLAAGRLRHQKTTGRVGLHYLPPLLDRHRFDWLAPADAGVVDEHVETVKRVERRLHRRLHLIGIRHVADGGCTTDSALAQLRFSSRQPLFAPRRDHHGCARLAQPDRHVEPKAARPAGDERDAAGEIEKVLHAHEEYRT